MTGGISGSARTSRRETTLGSSTAVCSKCDEDETVSPKHVGPCADLHGTLDFDDLRFRARVLDHAGVLAIEAGQHPLQRGRAPAGRDRRHVEQFASRLRGCPNLVRAPLWAKPLIQLLFRLFFISAGQGGSYIVRPVAQPELSAVSGKYFDKADMTAPSVLATDEALARRLWDVSASKVKLLVSG